MFSKNQKQEANATVNTNQATLSNDSLSVGRSPPNIENAAENILNSTAVKFSPDKDTSGAPDAGSDMETTITDYSDGQNMINY